ncbi:MAG: tRNA (adenosine(37)-N6)-threonylcarbamoyltransferase complex ATPase subunit type 1 TsaE [Bacteroidota bacterium]
MQTVEVQNQAESVALAERLGQVLAPGDVVILNGALAAGKTFFVKSLTEALGSTDYISSPTYTIANFYNIPQGSVLHMDAYRLESIEEFRDLGLEEYFPDVITLIEWGDKVADDFEDYLVVNIDFVGQEKEQRHYQFAAVGTRAQEVLEKLKA